MKTFIFLLVLRTRKNNDIFFITLNENIKHSTTKE